MATVHTRLITSGKYYGARPDVDLGGNRYNLDLKWRDIKKDKAKKIGDLAADLIRKRVVKEAGLSADQVAKVTKQGFLGHDGQVLVPIKKDDWEKIAKALVKAKAKPPHIPNPLSPNEPEKSLIKEGRATVTFRNIEEPHYLDGVGYYRIERLPGESEPTYIRRVTKALGGKQYNPGSKKTRDSLNGVSQSVVPRKNYEAEITLEGAMADFFQGRESFVSQEIFAKNGYSEGGAASSFNRFADRPTLLRSVEAEDGSVDLVPGRASNLSTAVQVSSFAFLSQMKLLRDPAKAHLAEGIVKQGDEYVFEFMPQSLLPTYGGGEKKMFKQLQKAYQELAKHPIPVEDPETHEVYLVRMRPLPAAACQFNYANTLERVLPGAVSGEFEARDESIKTDQALFQRVDAMTDEFVAARADRFGITADEFRERVADTRYFLEKQDNLWPWQDPVLEPHEELMARAFLAHLLGIPLVDNCKSVVDRTNVLNAAVTSMKQWLRSGKELPRKDGKVAIFDLPKVEHFHDGRVYYPFKELFAISLHKGVKVAEFSRGEKGYKFNRGFFQHPSLKLLLPGRYLKKKVEPEKLTGFKRWAIPIAGWILPPTLFQAFAWCGMKATGATDKELNRVWLYQKKLWKKGILGKIGAVGLSVLLTFIPVQWVLWAVSVVYSARYLHKPWRMLSTIGMPAKMVARADAFNPKLHVNEHYRKAGEYQLLYSGAEADPLLFEDSDS